MTLQAQHDELVNRTCKDGQVIVDSLTADSAHILHMAVGVAGEAGELLDAVKKYSVYCKDLDIENVIEELGDLEYYMNGLRTRLGISRETILQYNIDKLNKRYATGYSDKAAQERADKT